MPCCSKNRTIIILIFLLALLGGGIYFYYHRPQFREAKNNPPASLELNPKMLTATTTPQRAKSHHVQMSTPLTQTQAQQDEDPLLLFHRTMDVSPFFLLKYPQEAMDKLTNFELSQVAEEEIVRLSEEFEKFYQISPSRQQLINFFRYQSRNRLEVIKDQVEQLQRLQEKWEQIKTQGDQDAIRSLAQERQQRLDDLNIMVNYENGVISR